MSDDMTSITDSRDRNHELDESHADDDMESLLQSGNDHCDTGSRSGTIISSLEIDKATDHDDGVDNNNNNNDDDDDDDSTTIIRQSTLRFGLIRTQSVGNMIILFPEYFYSDGWGVIGAHPFGPVCVWLMLLGATHGCIRGINKHGLGIFSVIICYIFLGLCTYRLTNVSCRDPGICLDQEIPGHETPERARQYRFCERCKVWQPPDGMHCPHCEVCISGYDHYCVWMGTCIGKKNYRQFVLFNMTWLFYVGYAFWWILIIGPIMMDRKIDINTN